MAHRPHQPINAVGLADGCERCAEIADDPLGQMDTETLLMFLVRVRAVERGSANYQSVTEARAAQNIIAATRTVARLEELGVHWRMLT